MSEIEKLILYVDDDEEDREFLSEALVKEDPNVQVRMAENGLQAIDYLQEAKSSRLPCLIILDLNMPFLDGHETFRRIRSDERLSGVPVMILSSSEKPEDKRCYRQMGIEYFTKPSSIRHIQEIARHMVSVCTKSE